MRRPKLRTGVQSQLFDPNLPFLNSEGVPDVVLMTEALVSLYRLDPAGMARNPFPALLEVLAADAAKLTAVFALHILVREVRSSLTEVGD